MAHNIKTNTIKTTKKLTPALTLFLILSSGLIVKPCQQEITLDPIANKFARHACIPTLLTLSIKNIPREKLSCEQIPQTLKLCSLRLKNFIERPFEMTTPNLTETIKLALCNKKILQSIDDLSVSSPDQIKEFKKLWNNTYIKNLQLLLAHLDLTQEDRNNLLIVAGREKNIEGIKFLIKNGAQGPFFEQWPEDSLHKAVLENFVYGTEIPTEKINSDTVNQPINLDRQTQNTPLTLAAAYNLTETMEKMLSVANQENRDDALICAVEYEALEASQILITNGVNVEKKSNSFAPLHIACAKESPLLTKLLASNCPNIDMKSDFGWIPLHMAASTNSIVIAQILIENGADVNAKTSDGDTPLHTACFEGNLEIAQLLILQRATVNAKNNHGLTPAHNACKISPESEKIMELLIENGADINAEANNGDTPLHTACFEGNLEIAQLLILQGAAVNAKNNYESTPAHNACGKGKEKILELLIKNSADIKTKDKSGNSLLHILCTPYSGSINSAKLLISLDANVNERNQAQKTPLHKASNYIEANQELVALLIENGADINAEDRYKETPLCCLSYVYRANPKFLALLIKMAQIKPQKTSGKRPLGCLSKIRENRKNNTLTHQV